MWYRQNTNTEDYYFLNVLVCCFKQKKNKFLKERFF